MIGGKIFDPIYKTKIAVKIVSTINMPFSDAAITASDFEMPAKLNTGSTIGCTVEINSSNVAHSSQTHFFTNPNDAARSRSLCAAFVSPFNRRQTPRL